MINKNDWSGNNHNHSLQLNRNFLHHRYRTGVSRPDSRQGRVKVQFQLFLCFDVLACNDDGPRTAPLGSADGALL
jgi:hypothetical protein